MKEILKDAGLTKNETLVYLNLLKLGKAKASKIIREAKVSSGKIYETLDKLIEKGLVKTVIENGVKTFIAADPNTLLLYLKEKEKKLREQEKKLENIIPDLKNLMKTAEVKETVSLIKGFRGISTLVNETLEKGKDIKVMGVSSSKSIKFNNFWKKWHRKRITLKKECKVLFSDYKSDYWKFFKKLKYTKVKESLSISPSAITIIDDNTFIFSYKEEFTCIHIKSQDISNSFTSLFNSLWKVAETHSKTL
ncbi:hypothetical protein HOD38_00405 [archaeon]|jgi:sugar-specific transcriptional regulator TrmB|nr:hypothetical protein [archaeon]MBT4396708.1 hypothetical protein [archaeon]MBT4441318.1 hypothetical protein [archaeon]